MRRGMCTRLYAGVAALVMVLQSTAALAASLFTTQEDFTGWNGSPQMTATGVASGSIGSNTTNGLGNTTAPGSPGTDGSLQLVWNSGAFNYIFSPGEQGNAPFLAALGTTASATATPGAGTITFDFTQPPPGTGNYYQLGLVLNYDGNFGQFFGTTVDNGNGTFTTTIPYTIAAHGSLTYFQLGVIYNSNFNTATPFTVDNIAVVPEPAALWFGAAVVGIGALRRRRWRA